MITILHIIGFLLLIQGIYQIIKYQIVIAEVRESLANQSSKTDLDKLNNFFILVPVLHEEKTINKFLNGINLQNYPKELFEVYIITTQKEYLKNVRPNTIDILNQIISENRYENIRLKVIHYLEDMGVKSHQLNYAFQHIKKLHGDDVISNSFFLFLDADSEVEPNTIIRFNNSIEKDTEIYQQPLLWFKNVREIKSPFMQSFAFLQSFFSVSYEIPMFIGKFFPWRLKYLVGHGLCTKGSLLLRIGGLPDIIEDVRLGRLSSFLDYKVKIVPGFGIVETAKNFSVYIKQSGVWFFGCGLFISDYLQSQTIAKVKGVKNFVLVCYGFFKAFRWLNKGLLHLIGLGLSVTYMSWSLVILYTSSIIVNSVLPVLLVANDFKIVWKKGMKNRNSTMVLLRSVLFSPILYMFNFIGLYQGLIKLLKFCLWGQITLPKTER